MVSVANATRVMENETDHKRIGSVEASMSRQAVLMIRNYRLQMASGTSPDGTMSLTHRKRVRKEARFNWKLLPNVDGDKSNDKETINRCRSSRRDASGCL